MDEFVSLFKDKRNLINLLVVAIILLGIPVGIQLIHQQQILRSRADVKPVDFNEGKCVVNRGGKRVAICPDVNIRIFSPLGGPASPSPAATCRPGLIDCAPPRQGCHYEGGNSCSCGQLVCTNPPL